MLDDITLDNITKMAYNSAVVRLENAGYQVRELEEDVVAEHNNKYVLAIDIPQNCSFSNIGIKQVLNIVGHDFGLKPDLVNENSCYLIGFQKYSLTENVFGVLGFGLRTVCGYINQFFD
ncbi:MAG: hypothetical protein U9R08_06315 [Nanoarchaeota archaeon]|nr:hypothetical protein [Nanoarchaeota archaeon]